MQICSSCGSHINSDSKYCPECGNNLVSTTRIHETNIEQNKPYKLRSPMLDSAIYDEFSESKDYSILDILSKSLWCFAAIFFFYACREIYIGISKDLFVTILGASKYFLVAFLCLIIPGVVSMLIRIEELLSEVYKENYRQDDF